MARWGATLAGGVYLRFLLGLFPAVVADDVGGVPPLNLGLEERFGEPSDDLLLPKFKRSVVPPPPPLPPAGALVGERDRDGDFEPDPPSPLGDLGRGGEGGMMKDVSKNKKECHHYSFWVFLECFLSGFKRVL